MAMPSPFGLLRGNALRLLRYLALGAGLAAMMAITVPSLNSQSRSWLVVILWCCLGFFGGELAMKSWPGAQAKAERNYLLTSSGIIDLLAVLPIPLALLIGVPTDTAWLLASLWLLKLAPVVPGLALLGRVIEQEARRAGERLRHLPDCTPVVCRGALCARAGGPARTVWQLTAVSLVGRHNAHHDRLRRRCA